MRPLTAYTGRSPVERPASLELDRTQVTDAGLEHRAGLKNLSQLHLTGTAVTDKGVAKLKAALPKCNITR
jgi:hypothetical protein